MIDNRKSGFTVLKVNKLAENYDYSITGDSIIDHHSTYHYDTAFLFPKKKLDVKQAYLYGGTRFDHFQKKFLRYCPVCLVEDINNVGEPYFHIEHQLAGIHLCPNCYTPLVNYMSDDIYNYIYIDKSKIKGNDTLVVPEIHKELAKMAYEILTLEYLFKDYKAVRDRIYRLLKERNAIYNKIISNEFITTIEQTYKVENDIDNYTGFDINEICEEIPKTLSKSDRIKAKPITYLVLIHYLAGSLENFIKTEPYKYKKGNSSYNWNSNELLTKHKNIVQKAIDEENITRSELRRRFQTSYSFLCAADKEWLDNKLPKSKRKSRYDIDFDREIKKLVEETYEALIREGKRITKANLAKNNDIRKQVLWHKNLPITKDFIASIIETPEQYDYRIIRTVIDSFINKNENFTYNRIRIIAKISCERFQNLKYITDEYLKEIGLQPLKLITRTKP